MVKENTYINIQAFMRNDLNLKGNELLAYAVIYGFSQDNESKFTGSANYIADWIGIDKRNVLNILKKLTEKNLIIKHKVNKNGVTHCDYEANKNIIGSDETSSGVVMKHHGGSDETSPHNIEDTIDTNNSIKEKTNKKEKIALGEFKNVLLTKEEVDKLYTVYNESYDDLAKAVDILDEYIENHATGRKYKNHYAVMRTNNWVYQKVYQYKQTAPIKRGELY